MSRRIARHALVGEPGAYAAAYQPLPGFPDAPYCCLRLPTGGGKTLLAAHAIGIARDTYLTQQHPLVLWLVTSTTIGDQTLDALKTPGHPYRQALEDQFGCLRARARHRRAATNPTAGLGGPNRRSSSRPCSPSASTMSRIAMSIATMRSWNRISRRCRRALTSPCTKKDQAREADCELRQPPQAASSTAVIDEAHNFTSTLSGETIGRIGPAAVVEFTATPVRSNVIVSATAAELKAADMIKLPIHLSQHGSWQAAVAHAVDNRAWLEGIAKRDGGGIRPIALYQAQPATEHADATVEVVRQHLIDDCRNPRRPYRRGDRAISASWTGSTCSILPARSSMSSPSMRSRKDGTARSLMSSARLRASAARAPSSSFWGVCCACPSRPGDHPRSSIAPTPMCRRRTSSRLPKDFATGWWTWASTSRRRWLRSSSSQPSSITRSRPAGLFEEQPQLPVLDARRAAGPVRLVTGNGRGHPQSSKTGAEEWRSPLTATRRTRCFVKWRRSLRPSDLQPEAAVDAFIARRAITQSPAEKGRHDQRAAACHRTRRAAGDRLSRNAR